MEKGSGRVESNLELKTVQIADLPTEARRIIRSIQSGEEFPYRQDGQVFANREEKLPKRKYGYYREYTVPQQGVNNRGAWRIVVGVSETGEVENSEEFYFTADHYQTFVRVQMAEDKNEILKDSE